MYTAIAVVVGIAIVGGFGYWLYAQGKKSEQNKTLKRIDDVQDKQLEIANMDRGVDATVERLRKHDF